MDSEGDRAPAPVNGDGLKDLAAVTTRVVQRAASILEEEIAAGIVAAKTIEQRIVDVESLRKTDPDEVIQRFRRDAHDVVDILVDVVHAASRAAGGVARRVVSIRGVDREPAAAAPGEGRIPTLTMPQPIKAGESTSLSLAVENESDQPTDAFEFHATEFVSATGHRIAPRQISAEPAALALGPKETRRVTVTFTAPHDAPAGTYSGLLQATKLEHLRAVLVAQVV